MNADEQQAIKQLLRYRVAFLATTGVHGAEASMAPFAIYQGDVLLHLSSLATHTKNIQQHAMVSLIICTPETPYDSPLALPRLSLQGRTSLVSEKDFPSAKNAYLQTIPDAEPLFSFADFQLFRLQPTAIRWIGGFGKARKIPIETWRKLSVNWP